MLIKESISTSDLVTHKGLSKHNPIDISMELSCDECRRSVPPIPVGISRYFKMRTLYPCFSCVTMFYSLGAAIRHFWGNSIILRNFHQGGCCLLTEKVQPRHCSADSFGGGQEMQTRGSACLKSPTSYSIGKQWVTQSNLLFNFFFNHKLQVAAPKEKNTGTRYKYWLITTWCSRRYTHNATEMYMMRSLLSKREMNKFT